MAKSRLTPGERIVSWRRIRGISIRQLAELAGLYHSALSRMEKGKQHVRAEEAERIAAALGITMAEFYGESEEAPAA